MKILITGASGFVGHAFWTLCRQRGWELRALGRRPMPDWDYQQIDLGTPLNLDFIPDVVVHLAARSSPWGTAREYQVQNVEATRHVVDFCRSRGRPHLIHMSTSAVLYRNEHQYDMDESTATPEHPINEYARTKLEAEEWVKRYPGDWTILRPRAVFGPGDTVVFPRILRAARSGKLPWIESDRPVLVDLIYIDTLVEYIARVVERRTTGLYLLTNNQPVELLPFLSGVFKKLGIPEPKRRISAAKAMRLAACVETAYRVLPFLGEAPVTRFGVSVFAYSKTFRVTKALADLGQVSVPLDEGVERFIDWQGRQP